VRTAVVCLLRAVNLGGHNAVKMDTLRGLCEPLGLENPRTLLQSGNLVFETSVKDMARLAKRIEQTMEQTFGFHSDVILRTAAEMRQVVEASPFAGRTGLHPAKLAVTFLAADPGDAAREAVRRLPVDPEELYIIGRELYVYYPNGLGRTKLQLKQIEKALKTAGTTRNWNTVTKLLEMAAPSNAHKTSA
jgi:uncharacterized protein (DUF1697 family)